MSTPTTEPLLERRAADYLDEVRSHLADLPTDERDDLLEDLEAHVHEVTAATDGPLDDALGPPAAFAAELRASAGLASAAVTDDRAGSPGASIASPGGRRLSVAIPGRGRSSPSCPSCGRPGGSPGAGCSCTWPGWPRAATGAGSRCPSCSATHSSA
jgi:HAAS